MRYKTSTEYLRDNLDVAAAGADPLFHVLTFVVNGPKEPRPLITNDPYPSGPPVVPPVDPPFNPSADFWTISKTVGADPLTIRAARHFAGAIDSLMWRGKEFISRTCTGDLLQSASAFDQMGECFNPTEAGSRVDGNGESSSVLLSLSAVGNVLKTKNQMAFYIPPGESSLGCGVDPDGIANNTALLSNHTVAKSVTIGHPSSAHVIEYLVEFYVAEAHTSGVFEAVTGYMPIEFRNFWAFNPAKGTIAKLSTDPGEQGLPIILQSDDDYAMGIYSPDLPQVVGGVAIGYGKFVSVPPTAPMVKWNLVFRTGATPVGVYSYRCYVVVGSLENVRVSLAQLHAYLKGSPPVIPPVIPPAIPPTGIWPPSQTPGLHPILDRANKREYFSSLRVSGGLLLGEYALGEGAPEIQFYDGTLKPEQAFPNRESIFDMIMPDDGAPIATSEHFASVYKRVNGGWACKYSRPERYALMLYLRNTGYILWANYTIWESNVSGLVRSLDNGNSWAEVATYPGKTFFGLAVEAPGNIYLVGTINNYPVIANISGSPVLTRTDRQGFYYWGAVNHNSVWSLGTCHDSVKRGYIDAYDGHTVRTVYQTDRPYIQAMGIKDGIRYAVATWDWSEATGNTSLLLSSADGYTWVQLCEIPCPHIIGMHFADGGIYLTGGRHGDYGRVYFYKV